MQQINFKGKSDKDKGITMFSIDKKEKNSILKFSLHS